MLRDGGVREAYLRLVGSPTLVSRTVNQGMSPESRRLSATMSSPKLDEAAIFDAARQIGPRMPAAGTSRRPATAIPRYKPARGPAAHLPGRPRLFRAARRGRHDPGRRRHQRRTGSADRALQAPASDRRGGHGHRLHGRARGACPPQGRAQDHQAGHGQPPGHRPLRGRAPGPGHDGPPEHRPRLRRRHDGDWPALLRHGAGPWRARSPSFATTTT